MNKRLLMIFCAVGMLMLASIACEASASTANISSVVLTADKANPVDTTTFTPDQTFYAIVTLANAPDTTKVKAAWTYTDEAGTVTPIGEKEIVGGASPIVFNASPTTTWPVGNYKVEIFLNDKTNKTIEFTVGE